MNKVLKSIWVRALSPIIGTISALGLAASILAIIWYSEVGGGQHAYRNIYEDIADSYALYAMEMVEEGQVDELAAYLTERGIACTVTKQLVGENQIVLPESKTVVFACGEVREDMLHQIEIVEGAEYNYNIDSLVAAIYGYNYYTRYGETISAEVEEIVFDKEAGRFYYETESIYFEVEDIAVYEAGSYIDYTLTKVEGEECYYNGYYKQKLDTTQYENWDYVRVGGEKHVLAPERGYSNAIYVTTTSEIESKGIGKHVVYSSVDYVEYYPTDYVSTYVIQIDWYEELVEEVSVFWEWNEVFEGIIQFENSVLPVLVISFILFIASIIVLVSSAIDEKENIGLLHKAPVAIYSGIFFFVEVLLCMLLVEGIPAVLISYGVGSVKVGMVLVPMTVGLMVWLALIWFQNIVTRLKCKSFWRTTEVYYTYKLFKKSWNYIKKPLEWCWEKITVPFRAVGRVCKQALHMAGENTPLLLGGLIAFGLFSLIEFYLAVHYWWYGGTYTFPFLFVKVVEVVALIIILLHMQELHAGSKRVASGDMSQPIDTSRMFWKFKDHGENINKVSEGIALAVEERMKSEHFKTELITNVSHDIKTPLTSIINYVDLIKKEDVQDEKVQEYIEVLDRQSARLKKLIEDLMEASKASTGNLAVNLEECDVDVLLTQMIGEFEEKLEKNQLTVVVEKPERPVKIMADGRHIWRVLDNLLNNACKYSLPNTRVYVNLKKEANDVVITFKNISKEALNIPSEELMERFVRGDSSRNTEGNGLGLSIAQSLTELMHGSMKLDIDGDLFKVTLRFPAIVTK